MITANRRAKATIGPMKHCTDTERNTPTGGELARERHIMPEQRKFPPPWTVEEGPACFIVRLRIFGDSDFNPKLLADPLRWW